MQEPHKPTKRLRHKVALLAAAGEGEIQIAHVIGVARETLRKYYGDEIANGRAGIRAQILDELWSAARQGNVAAMKHLDARTSGEPRGSVGYVSKKKLAEEAAKTVGGEHSEWGDDLRPPNGIEVN